MSIPEPILDDLRFQKDLVDEARRRIVRYSPDWTDYNVSDPGITLIELFAWMTELITYRLNRVPEKNYARFLDLLGVRLRPARSATTEVTFRLAVPFPVNDEDHSISTTVPRGYEISARQAENEPEVIFTTDEPLQIGCPILSYLRREQEFNRDFLARLNVEPFQVFNPQPLTGDTFYMGFDPDQPIAGYVLKLAFDCVETQATGISRDNPPLVWECSVGNDEWQRILPSTRPREADTTGGLNNAQGSLVLYLPLRAKPSDVHGRSAYWIRCRHEPSQTQRPYSQSPRLTGLRAYALGAATWATNAVLVYFETLGASDGEPGQRFRLQHAPVLDPRAGETVEVEETVDGELVWVAWTRVDEFSGSSAFDRHYCLDTATGEVSFGPAVRQQDGKVIIYGRVPEARRGIRFSQYRYGGGVTGNVPEDRVVQMRSAIAYVDNVSNLVRATGGLDPETVEAAKYRARQEVRSQKRAVTADDYEHFAREASTNVARVKCNPFLGKQADRGGSLEGRAALAPGMVDLIVIPAAFDAVRHGDLTRLSLDGPTQTAIINKIDEFRLLTVTMRVREPIYIGVRVITDIVLQSYARPEVVQARVRDTLRGYITPLAIGGYTPPDGETWEGWPIGRDLYLSEIYALIQRVPGVKHVRDVKLGSVPIKLTDTEIPTVTATEKRVIDVPPDGVLCSLDHDVRVVTL